MITLILLPLGLSSPALAAEEMYRFDPSHTNIVWSANHFGFSNPSGKFAKSDGTVTLDENKPEHSKVSITIDTNSIVTGLEKFDAHLKGKDFFDTEKFPTASFTSTSVEVTGKTTAKVHGNLTLLGVTKPVVLDMTLNKIGEHPMTKKKWVGFSGATVIKRSEFGMMFGIPAVSDEVKISIEAEAGLP